LNQQQSKSKKTLKLLPHQYELFKDSTTPIIGLVSGFGGGKTFIATRKACALALSNPGSDGIITEPTHPLLVQILIPEMIEALEYFNIPFRLNKADYIFYCSIGGKETRIICKSLENYDRLIGINAAWAILDEFDTTKADIAYTAYQKILGRLRAGNSQQMVIVSTPEGFRAFHRIFVTENASNKRLIHAKTTDNKHLPEEYISLLYDTYPENLIKAYIDGEFVNLTQGSVYPSFDRKLNGCNTVPDKDDHIHIGLDFNVGNMSGVAHVLRGDCPHAVSEFSGLLDTPAIISAIKHRYNNKKIYVYPDASGASKKSVNASESDITLLRQAGFVVLANKKNPYVTDRVMSMNAMICKGENRRYFINTDNCPETVECLEQQAYDKSGVPDKTSGKDHLNDAVGYMVSYRYPIAKRTGLQTKVTGI